MKKACGLFLALAVCMLMLPLGAAAAPADTAAIPYGLDAAEIISAAAVLMDGDTGQILFDKNMSQKVYPASTTKIMTGLVVTENTSPDEIVSVNQSAVDIDEWDSANISLAAGETLTVESALYALMLPSANDAANALAEHVAGSQADFVQLMNEKAGQIGAVNTRFANAHGLHDDDHYTTARDMALITRYALGNSRFMRYFSADKYTMPATNLQPIERNFTNYQSMLVRESEYYDPVVTAGKVGFTNEARHTMSSVARKNGRTLICVVMDSPGRTDKFADTAKLMDYGFNQFRQITLNAEEFTISELPASDGSTINFHSESDFTAWLRNDLSLDDVRIDFRIPDTFGTTDRLPTSVEVVTDAAGGTLPVLLGLQPLVSELYLDGVLAPVSLNTPVDSGPAGADTVLSLQLLVVFALTGILLLLISVLLWRYRSLQKRRRERMERLNRRMRDNYTRGKEFS